MVDFNNETTITRPASDIVRVLILQRRSDLFDAFETIIKAQNQGVKRDLSLVKARLFTLYLELEAWLKRALKEKEFIEFHHLISSNNHDDILKAISIINIMLDKIRLIRIDTRQQYDSTRVEIENRMKKL